jgi:RNA polymerase sigma-70 factor (ECF subfamily)
MTALAHNLAHIRKPMITPDQVEQMAHWQDLVSKVAHKRDRKAFAELFDQFAPRIKAFSLKALPGSDLVAEDLVQDVMIKVWNKAHLYKPEAAAVSTWIFTLARNTRIDQIRKNKHIRSEIDVDSLFDVLEDNTLDPFQATQIKNTEQLVRQSINNLPPDQAQVIAKTFLEGKSHSEAAAELGLPLGTVKSRIRIALEKLELSLRGVADE